MIDDMVVRINGVNYPVKFEGNELLMWKDGCFMPLPEDYELVVTYTLWEKLTEIWPVKRYSDHE